MAAFSATGPSPPFVRASPTPWTVHGGCRCELYSMAPLRCCCSVNETLKSGLNSPSNEDAQGNVHPIRRLYACSLASGARDTAASVTSWLARRTTEPSTPSAIAEQYGHPAV